MTTALRVCRDCGKDETQTRFNGSRRSCERCRCIRREYLKRHPEAERRVTREHTANLWERILKFREIDENGCWNWTGRRDKQGYGYIVAKLPWNGVVQWRPFGVHRIVAHLEHGLPLDERNLYACHHCDNPACFNPEHIFVGSPQDNMDDCFAKGRKVNFRRGSEHPNSILTEADVPEIRNASQSGESSESIARRYGVSGSTVRLVVNGKRWTHVA